MGFCCESLAFTCTMDRFEAPGAMAFTTIPMIVPVPLTPAVFGWRVAEIIACPCGLLAWFADPHPEQTMAISWFPPDRNPPCCTSSTLITAGLNCRRNGIENRSFTFSTTTPIVCDCPTFSDALRGSNRICEAFAPPGTVVAAPNALGTVGGAPCAEGDRKSTRLNSSHLGISYAVFCLKKKNE